MNQLTKFIAAITLGLGATLSVIPAYAGIVVLPNLFAKEYCAFRSEGYGKRDALRAAMDAASYEGEPTTITRPDGSETSVDSVRAARAIADRCPQYLK